MPSGASPRIATRPTRSAEPEPSAGFLAFLARRSLPEWAFPAALAALAIRSRLVSADLRLEEMPGRTLGVSVLRGVDVAARTMLLFEAAALVVLAAGASLAAAWWVRRRLTRGGAVLPASLRQALAPAHALAAVSLATLLSEDGYPAFTRAVALVGAAAVALVIGVAASMPGRSGSRPRERGTAAVMTAVAIAGWGAAHAVSGLAGRSVVPPAAHLASALAIAAAVVLVAWRARTASRREAWMQRLSAATFPLVLLPLAPCVAQELAYSVFLRGGPSLPFRPLSLAFVGALGAAALVVARRAPRPGALSPARRLSRRHMPAALAVLAIVRTWAPAGSLRGLDLFHDGEAAVPVHQLVRFGALPYLDVFPTQGLGVGYAGGLLEWILTGTVTGDGRMVFTVPLLAALGTVATYALVRRVSGSALLGAFVAAVLPAWPVSWVLPYAVGFFGLVALANAAARAAGGSFLRVGLWLLALTLIRADAGIMFAGVVGVVAGVRAIEVARAGGVRAAVTGVLLPAFGPAAGAVGLAVCVMVATRPGAWETLAVFREFMSLEFQALSMGIPPVWSPAVPRADSRFVVLLLPAATLVGAALLALRQPFGRGRWDARDVLAVALFGYNTLLLTRALGRHTEAEMGSLAGFASSFTLLLGLVLALRLGRDGPRLRSGAIGAALVVVALVPLPGGSLFAHAAAGVPLPATVRPDRMSPWSPRFAQPAASDAGLRALQRFVSDRLRPGDRILDLSHEPLLYVALDRAFPGHVVPILYATSERTQRQLLRALGPDVRLVVLRDANHWRDIDGVPDPLRSYRVYEYVHRRFPWAGRVGPYTVLLEEKPELESVPVTPVALALLGEQARNDIEVALDGSAVVLSARGRDPYVEIPVPPVRLAEGDRLGVEAELASRAGATFQVYFGARGEPFTEAFSGTFVAGGASSHRVESPPAARDLVVDRIRFDPPEGVDARLERIAIRRVSSGPVPVGMEERLELFEVGLLPWYWARSDAAEVEDRLGARSRTVPTAVPLRLEPRRTIPIPLGGVAPAPEEQVRVTVRAEAPGILAVRYGREGVATAGMAFDVVPGVHAYVLRFGAQASWAADPRPVTTLELESRSDAPLTVEALVLERAD